MFIDNPEIQKRQILVCDMCKVQLETTIVCDKCHVVSEKKLKSFVFGFNCHACLDCYQKALRDKIADISAFFRAIIHYNKEHDKALVAVNIITSLLKLVQDV